MLRFSNPGPAVWYAGYIAEGESAAKLSILRNGRIHYLMKDHFTRVLPGRIVKIKDGPGEMRGRVIRRVQKSCKSSAVYVKNEVVLYEKNAKYNTETIYRVRAAET